MWPSKAKVIISLVQIKFTHPALEHQECVQFEVIAKLQNIEVKFKKE
jgi:hypothetical protein